jgi:hypothetical protein
VAVAALSIAVPLVLVLAGGHRGVHAARNLLVPGAGLYDHAHLPLGLAFTAAFVVATVGWVRWGVDWPVPIVVIAAAVTSSALTSSSDQPLTVARSAHEFPLIVLVVGAVTWVRHGLARIGLGRGRRSSGRRQLEALAPVERCHAVAISCLADGAGPVLADAVTSPDVARRARRIGFIARGRRGGDPFRVDHAPARAARSLCGLLDDDERSRFALDAAAGIDGVPCSEPGWARLLDATLAAMALRRAGDEDAARRWSAALAGRWARRRRHRPAAAWSPLGVPLSHAAPWEHAAATAIAHAAGWCDDDDWPALRRSALAAAARSTRRPHDERLVAAGRIWVTQVDDEVAARVLARPTIGDDPVAAALDHLARRLRDAPSWLSSPSSSDPSAARSPTVRSPP